MPVSPIVPITIMMLSCGVKVWRAPLPPIAPGSVVSRIPPCNHQGRFGIATPERIARAVFSVNGRRCRFCGPGRDIIERACPGS